MIGALVVKAALSLLAGGFDRFRGDSRGIGKALEITGMALCFWFIMELPISWWMIPYLVCVLAGTTPGWSFIGAVLYRTNRDGNPETWEKVLGVDTFTRYNDLLLVLFIRALMWGLPTVLLSFWYPPVYEIGVAMIASFFGSVFISQRLSDNGWKIGNFVIAKGRWGKNEYIRGFICAAGLAGVSLL